MTISVDKPWQPMYPVYAFDPAPGLEMGPPHAMEISRRRLVNYEASGLGTDRTVRDHQCARGRQIFPQVIIP